MEPELTLIAPSRDLGDGFLVRRALPAPRRRMVGPFLFFDQMGPVAFRDGQGLDVRPHPHIGLATVTYLFEGEIVHRDSLGNVQRITAGAVNWMTAGRGIAHSERTAPERRIEGERVFGIQLWVALPREKEEVEPAFAHTAAKALPELTERGVHLRVVLGELLGKRSPVALLSPMFYVALTLDAGARFALPPAYDERAAYVAEGAVKAGDETYGESTLLVFRKGDEPLLEAARPSRVLLLGGPPSDGPRHMYWNFVSSSVERIEQAKADWRAGRFGKVPGETEFIPLPDDPPPVRYS